MTELFQIADWLLVGFTVVSAVLGLFRGFSGTLAFVVAIVASMAVGSFGWRYSEMWTQVAWMRGVGTLVASLLAFGVVRLVVKKLVNGLMAQPSDAIFGFLIGAAIGGALIVAWAWSGLHLEYSHLATLVSEYV